jgi:DNA (cytosine-5)-methyltransferase 1
MSLLTSLEICAGAGGQALGLERAGFEHVAAVEIEEIACETLKANRQNWKVITKDVRELEGADYRGVDLIAGGVPCPPFSVASRQLGADDERDLFPAALRLVAEAKPQAVMLENVPGLASPRFEEYRKGVRAKLAQMGYGVHWQLINASDFGVPQLRPRFVLVALREAAEACFSWPTDKVKPKTVGEELYSLMSENGWPGAAAWAQRANKIAPTLVGGSRLHGGPDLGPTRAKRQWRELGVDGLGVADFAPDQSFPIDGLPKLTVRMTARLQGFPDSWEIKGRKTAAYRQVGNAFPPPVAHAIGARIYSAVIGDRTMTGIEVQTAIVRAS